MTTEKKINEAAARLLMSMPFAVYSEPRGALEAVFAEADHAASFVAVLGDGAVIVANSLEGINPSWVLWTEGKPGDGSAGDSYDMAADLMLRRLDVFVKRSAAGIHIGVAR